VVPVAPPHPQHVLEFRAVYLFSGAKLVAEYLNGALPSSPAREWKPDSP
jgi:hypothetical protein